MQGYEGMTDPMPIVETKASDSRKNKEHAVDTVNGDPFCLQSSNYLDMILVSALLIRSRNFKSWNRAMRIALGAKQKLGFIDDVVLMPSKDNEFFLKWKRCDYMVTSWILNSISKGLVDGFIYKASLKDLWCEITERFGESNGTQI